MKLNNFYLLCMVVSIYLVISIYSHIKLSALGSSNVVARKTRGERQIGNFDPPSHPHDLLTRLDEHNNQQDEIFQQRKRHYFQKASLVSQQKSFPTYQTPSLFQFPTPEERVRYYMGSWYNKSIPVLLLDNDNDALTNNICKKLEIGQMKSIPSDKDVLYSFRTLLDRHKMKENWLSSYLRDAANVLTHIESTVDQGAEEDIFVILRIGDSTSDNSNLPSVSKARRIPKEGDGYSSIVWPLRLNHHFDRQFEKLFAAKDTSWEKKKNVIVWRGACTGAGAKNRGASQTGSRLIFVKKYALLNESDSKTNIGMIGSCSPFGTRLENKYFKNEMNVEEMLTYKYLLSLEGNDVATGLKWKLASSSVVFMPTPMAESYAIEGLLQPFVHYIPVERDGSDLDKMIQWAEENDSKAKWISDQASEFMNNLWFSDKARMDNALIKNELANLYHLQFHESLQFCYNNYKQ